MIAGAESQRPPWQHALIIHSGALGDTILMLSLARALREVGIPRVSVLGRGAYQPLINLCPDVSQFYDIDTAGHHTLFSSDSEIPRPIENSLKQHDFVLNMLADSGGTLRRRLLDLGLNLVIDIMPNQRNSLRGHITEQWLADIRSSLQSHRLRLPLAPPHPQLKPSFAGGSVDSQTLGVAPFDDRCHTNGLPFTILHPGSGSRTKCWPFSNFIELANILRNANRPAAILLGPVELERFSKSEIALLRMAAPTIETDDLRRLAAVLANASTLIANDSGIAHLAAALGTQVIAIFGPTDPCRWQPLGPRVTVMYEPPHWPTVESVARELDR